MDAEPTRIYLISKSPALRAAMLRVVHASGCKLTILDGIPDLQRYQDVRFVVVEASAVAVEQQQDLERLPPTCSVLILNEVFDQQVVNLLQSRLCSHAVQVDQLDLDQFIVTMNKLLSGDVFGLDKYLPWGVPITSIEIASYDEKRAAIAQVGCFLRDLGCRRPTVARIEATTDELLLNALYDAPTSGSGDRQPVIDAVAAGAAAPSSVTLRFASGGRFFVLSVTDTFGRLAKGTVVERLAPREGKLSISGGVGLYLLITNATRVVVNVARETLTEVIFFFALDTPPEGFGSFHYFEQAPKEEPWNPEE